MRVIGLTGSISCGKSTVSRFLLSEGLIVIDGDQLSRLLTGDGGAALPAIRDAFGWEVFHPDGSLNRKQLGRLIFQDEVARKTLDDLMLPLLREMTERALQKAEAARTELCFLDMPLLFEKGFDALCDAVWSVWVPTDIQIERLMKRDRLSEGEARRRIAAQLSSDEKANRADFVIDNSGSVEETLEQIPDRLAYERSLARASARRRRMDRYREASEEAGTAAAATMRLSGSIATQAGRTDAAAMPLNGRVPARAGRAEAAAMPPTGSITPRPGRAEAAAMPPTGSITPRPGRAEATAMAADVAPMRVTSSEMVPPPPIERPAGTERAPSRRKAAWKLPVWLGASLIALSALIAIAFTSQCLMSAYLKRQADLHVAEQQAIDENYPMAYREMIEKSAEEYQLQPAFVTAIIRNESSFRPRAESSVGARGLMQLMPDTAEWIAQKTKTNGYAFERMYDPETNIRFGCWYLNYLSRLFSGDPVCVACAYHAGQGTVTSWLSDSRYSSDGVHLTLENLPEGPTRQYAERVTRDYGIYQKKVFSAETSGDMPADVPADGSHSAAG